MFTSCWSQHFWQWTCQQTRETTARRIEPWTGWEMSQMNNNSAPGLAAWLTWHWEHLFFWQESDFDPSSSSPLIGSSSWPGLAGSSFSSSCATARTSASVNWSGPYTDRLGFSFTSDFFASLKSASVSLTPPMMSISSSAVLFSSSRISSGLFPALR